MRWSPTPDQLSPFREVSIEYLFDSPSDAYERAEAVGFALWGA